jgi:hypothetical protein
MTVKPYPSKLAWSTKQGWQAMGGVSGTEVIHVKEGKEKALIGSESKQT